MMAPPFRRSGDAWMGAVKGCGFGLEVIGDGADPGRRR